jgi:hypothetical protein
MLVATAAAQPAQTRASLSEKGSVLIYPRIEVVWDNADNLKVDTFITVSNDYEAGVNVVGYYVTEECTDMDLHFNLTANEAAYWSVLTGAPGPNGALGSFTTAGDPIQPVPGGDKYLRGLLILIAVRPDGFQIRWNHLFGEATIVDYAMGTAWEYNAYAFGAYGTGNGMPVGTQKGLIKFNQTIMPGYASAFRRLLFNFFKPNSSPYLGGGTGYYDDTTVLDGELTLMILPLDLTALPHGPFNTYYQFEIFDENENGQTGLEDCMDKWEAFNLSNLGGYFTGLPTAAGYARVWGIANDACDTYIEVPPGSGNFEIDVESIDAAMLGVYAEMVEFVDSGAALPTVYGTAGGALRGSGNADTLVPCPGLKWTSLTGGEDKIGTEADAPLSLKSAPIKGR